VSEIEIIASVTVSPYTLVEGCDWSHDRLIELVLGIGEEFASLEFTIELRDKLNEIIEEERK